MRPSRPLLAATVLCAIGFAFVPATAAADTKRCTASSVKIGFHRYSPASCVVQYRCQMVAGCAADPYIAVRPWFMLGQQGSIGGRGTFVPLSLNTLFPGSGTEPQVLTCSAPKPSDSNFGLCLAFGEPMALLQNEVVAATCQAPVNPKGVLLFPPKDVSVTVECAINGFPLNPWP